MSEIKLSGCTTSPLSGYLKALGVFRLLAEQKDHRIKCFWHNSKVFVIETQVFNEQDLINFFINEYKPTPIVAPWNKGSGFHSDAKSPKAIKNVEAIKRTKDNRFKTYRDVIEQAANAASKFKDKTNLIKLLRGTLPEEVIPWFNAVVVLTNDKNPQYPPLLGTGGNDGRLDFTNNFMEHLINTLVDENQDKNNNLWLRHVLFGQKIKDLLRSSVGQFDPGGVGGPNASSGFSGNSLVNPWNFILMIEGTLLFGAMVSRRLETSSYSYMSYPFTVKSSGIGSGVLNLSDESQARAEMWMPLWERKASYDEIKFLLSEGRIRLNRSQAAHTLDVCRAIHSFGVDRGIKAFQRYIFVQRSGKAHLALPLNLVNVTRNPRVDLINELENKNWLNRLRNFARQKDTPLSIKSMAKNLEDGIFEFSKRGDKEHLQSIVITLGKIHGMPLSTASRYHMEPIPWLSQQWAEAANDGSPEFLIAAALASIGQNKGKDGCLHVPMQWYTSSESKAWKRGDLLLSLRGLCEKLILQHTCSCSIVEATAPTTLDKVMRFLEGKTDDRKVLSLLPGLSCIKFIKPLESQTFARGSSVTFLTPLVFSLLKPFFTSSSILERFIPGENTTGRVLHQMVRLFSTEDPVQIRKALELAVRRLRIVGLSPPTLSSKASFGNLKPLRLLAALMIPLVEEDLLSVLKIFSLKQAI